MRFSNSTRNHVRLPFSPRVQLLEVGCVDYDAGGGGDSCHCCDGRARRRTGMTGELEQRVVSLKDWKGEKITNRKIINGVKTTGKNWALTRLNASQQT